jgi:hypothetical protein
VSRKIAQALAVTGVCTVIAATGTVAAQPSTAAPEFDPTDCPALYTLGVQGTGQSSLSASPTVDSGLLSGVLAPLLASISQPGAIDRAYVPYPAAFGGIVPGAATPPYAQSVAAGLDELRSMARAISNKCENTHLALLGYSQGAHVVSLFLREVGLGHGVVAPDKIAGAALFGDPTRDPGAPAFPGAPGQLTPAPAPGTDRTALAGLSPVAQTMPTGGGIGPQQDIATDFGALTGRVASLCIAEDLTCDAPTGTPILHALTNIIGQALLSPLHPFTALSSIIQAVVATTVKTAAAVASHDLVGNTLGTLMLTSERTLSQRLAEASDPRVPVYGPDAQAALLKVATVALNILLAVVGVTLEPSEVADILNVGENRPLDGIALLTEKVTGPRFPSVPIEPARNLVTQAFDAVAFAVADNAALLEPATWVRYQDVVARHGAYVSESVTETGQTPAQFVADWFAALARSLATPKDSAAEATAAPSSPSRPMGPDQAVAGGDASPPANQVGEPATAESAPEAAPVRHALRKDVSAFEISVPAAVGTLLASARDGQALIDQADITTWDCLWVLLTFLVSRRLLRHRLTPGDNTGARSSFLAGSTNPASKSVSWYKCAPPIAAAVGAVSIIVVSVRELR